MKFKNPTCKDIEKAFADAVGAIKETTGLHMPDPMSEYVKATSRRLASIREDEIRDIEAAGGKVTRIEVDQDGNETLVTENSMNKTGVIMDDPLNVINGPHMYSDDCHCESCAGWRAKQSAGMHIDVETVRTDAKLMRQAALDRRTKTGKWEDPDPIMQVPCSVVLALCDKAESDATKYTAAFALQQQNAALRRELAEIKEGTRTVNDVASSMFPGAVEGWTYGQVPGDPMINYDGTCKCGQRNAGAFPENTQHRAHTCFCGNRSVVWDTEPSRNW